MKAFFLTFFLVSTFSSSAFSDTPGEVKTGSYLRETILFGFDGKIIKLSDFKGKPLIINVWASWCGPCRAEMGSLERLSKLYNGKEFNIIGVSTDDDSRAASAFIKQSGVTFKNFLDRKLLLENMLGADRIPLTILVDADGRVLKKVRGSREWDDPKIIDTIKKVFQIKLKDKKKEKDDPMFGLHFLNR